MTGTTPLLFAPEALQAPEAVRRIGGWALLVGALAAVVCGVGFTQNPGQFYRSYLVAVLLWLGVAVGCSALAMLHHLSRGDWGLVIRRPWEAASRTLPWLALLFVPLLFGLPDLYLWARPEAVAADELLRHKTPYLNVPFFLGRTAFYFAVWWGFALMVNHLSRKQDRAPDPGLSRTLRLVSAPGLALYCLTATFAAFDWLMSLDPHWFSTIYGVYFVGGHGLSALAFTIPLALFLAGREPLARVFSPRHFHDYGNLLLAFVMLWAYFAVSQFLIIWSGNLPEEIPWYLDRLTNSWRWVGLGLVLLHFAVPFAVLLSRDVKRNARRLAGVAGLVFVMRWVDLHWQVAPTFHHHGITLHWLDLAAPVAVGGIWIALFAWELGRRPLLPVNDPYLPEALGHE